MAIRRRALVLMLSVLVLTGVPAAAASTPPEAPDVAALVDREADRAGLPGLAVTVTRGGSVLYAGGRGRDHDGAPMTATTPLRLASLSKSFTAVAVLRLAARGRIALDRPVAGQLPGFGLADPRGATITPRELLTQTSGLTDATASAAGVDDAADPADAVGRLRSATLDTDPGRRFAYTNANYEIAARLLEIAAGAPLADVLHDEVFAPLRMDHTGLGRRDDAVPGAVSVLGVWIPRTWPASLLSSGGAAGVVSTADDLARWLTFQNGDGRPLLSAADLAVTHSPGDPGHGYAMGWIVDTATTGHPVLGHTGSMLTRTSAQIVDPRTGVGVAVAAESASLWEDPYEIAGRLLVAAAGGQPGPVAAGRRTVDGVLAGIALVAVALGVLGVARARRWSRRRSGSSPVLVVLRLLPAAAAVGLAVAWPWVAGAFFGLTATWAVLTTLPASATVAVVAVGGAGAATLVARAVTLAVGPRA